MTTGRKVRLALAAFLAAVFVFVLVGHSGTHASSTTVDPPCAMCSSGEVAVTATPDAPVFSAPRVLVSVSEARLENEAASHHRPRGPPLAG